MKIKLKETNKKIVKEVIDPFSIILFALFVNTLAVLYPMLTELVRGIGSRLKFGVKRTYEAVEAMNIPKEEKQNLKIKIERAKNDLESTLKQIEENLENDETPDEKPSEIIKEKIIAFKSVIDEVQDIYDSGEDKNPEVENALIEARQYLEKVYKDVSNLDFIAALASKDDPSGLYKNTNAKVVFSDDKNWVKFAKALAEKIPEDKRSAITA